MLLCCTYTLFGLATIMPSPCLGFVYNLTLNLSLVVRLTQPGCVDFYCRFLKKFDSKLKYTFNRTLRK